MTDILYPIKPSVLSVCNSNIEKQLNPQNEYSVALQVDMAFNIYNDAAIYAGDCVVAFFPIFWMTYLSI